MKFRNLVLVSLLCASMVLVGCSAAQFEQYLNAVTPAISIILQILSVAGGPSYNAGIVSKVDADVKALDKLYADYQSVSAGSQSSVKAQIDVAFQLLNQDLQTVFSLAHVSNSVVQQKVAMEIGLVESAVQLAESLLPSTAAAQQVKAELKANELVASFNAVNHAKTGLKAVDDGPGKKSIHRHSKVERVLSFGLVK